MAAPRILAHINQTKGSNDVAHPHTLADEFPNDHAVLHELKVGNPHYVTLADRYHDVNDEIHRIDAGIETPSDDYAETLKKKRLALIDEIAGLVAKAKAN